jgi:hypothetical protein
MKSFFGGAAVETDWRVARPIRLRGEFTGKADGGATSAAGR